MTPSPAADAAARDVDGEFAARLRLAIARLSRRLSRHSPEGLTQGQLSALVTVEAHGPLPVGEVATREGIGAPVATRLVQSLVEQRLLERAGDPADRRCSLLTLSAEGARLLGRIRQERTAQLTAALSALTPRQRRDLLAALPVLEDLAAFGAR